MTTAASRASVVVADITTLDVDAIVNAANKSLLGGGGVDGAIHRRAGPELREACAKLGGCDVGDARITPGFNLPARWVIHTVGPFWSGGGRGEAERLAACYHRSLELAVEHGLHTVAFPAISTGAYRYPPEQAAEIAVSTVMDVLEREPGLTAVTFCCFSEASAALHRQALEARGKPSD
jgi:O-acetyl-ADP-ribose deacetylase (regulator of RNase III)